MNCLPCSRGGQNIGENRPCIPKWMAIASVVTAAALLAVGGLAIISFTSASPPFLSSLTGVVGKGGMLGISIGTIFLGGSLLAIPFIHINQKEQASSGTKKQESSTSTIGEGNMVSVPEGWTPLHYHASKLDVANINRILDESTDSSPHLTLTKVVEYEDDEGQGRMEGVLPIRLFVLELLRRTLVGKNASCMFFTIEDIRNISEERILVARRLSEGVDLRGQISTLEKGVHHNDREGEILLRNAWEALCARIERSVI